MNILIPALLGVIVGIVIGIIIYWAASGDNSEEEIKGLKNEALSLFVNRQVEINQSLHDFNMRQMEINTAFNYRIEIITRKLNALEQDLKFCPKISDSFFQER